MINKKFPVYLPILMIAIVFFLCREDLQSKEEEIAAYIVNNQDALTYMVNIALDNGTETVELIDGVNGISCWKDNTAVDFKYYSIGLGSAAGTHYGFYYSPQDTPVAYEAADMNLISDDGGWIWCGEDNQKGFTRKLMDNWYYYEASY